MHTKLKNLIQVGVSTALVLGVGTAWAFPGHLTGMSAQKKVVKVGEDVNLTVTGTVQCGVTINNANGKIWTIALTDTANPATKFFGTSFNKAGKFHVTAQGQGNGNKDCSLISVVGVDITVLGDAPACTSDMGLQKDYQAIGIQVKTCEVASTPPAMTVNRPTLGETTASAGSANPGLGVAHTKVTNVSAPASVSAGNYFVVKVNGTMGQGNCPTSIVIDQISPDLKSNYGNLASPYQSSGFERSYSFRLTEKGTYQARILVNAPGNTQACGYNGEKTIPGDLSKIVITDPVAQ
nr:hypothetical protein [Rhodoferax sp.]